VPEGARFAAAAIVACGVSVRSLRWYRNNGSVARDYYDVLGVGQDADADAVKQAYRALARELHPDVSAGNDGERFREVTEAYSVLSDDRSRRLYDRLGWRGRGSRIAPRKGTARLYASNPRAFLEDLETIVATALGRPPEKKLTRIVGEVEIDAYEAYLGAARSVDVDEPQPCEACAGLGRRKLVSKRESARFLSVVDCPDCEGSGKVEAARPVDVTVPPRARHLDRIPVGPEEVAIVRIVPPEDRLAIRLAASVALLAAIGFLLFLLAL
jgi:DnaJ-class molecular chaperone